MVRPEDDSFHPSGDDPYWNESGWFPFNIPDRLISGWIMIFHRPNMKLSVGGIAIWDPSGENPFDCLFYDWGDIWALEPHFDMFNCALPSGLNVKMVEPLQEFHISYLGNGCRLDLQWRAVGEAHYSQFTKGADAWGTGHFEQPGRMSGTIALEGETMSVDCWSNRDHSWGPRRPLPRPRADFPWGLDAEGNGFHLYALSDLPQDEDPIDGTSERMLFGWNRIGGVTSALVSGDRRVVERGPDGRPLAVEIRGTDELGRKLIATGVCVNWLKWQGYPFTYQWWCMVRWVANGAKAWGEIQEFYPLQQSRRYLRSRNAELGGAPALVVNEATC